MRRTKDGSFDKRFKGADEKNAESLVYMLQFLGILLRYTFLLVAILTFCVVLPVAICHYYFLRKKYLLKGARRINDIGNLKSITEKVFLNSFVVSFILAGCYMLHVSTAWLIILSLYVLWHMMTIARWSSIVYFGVIVDSIGDRIYFRQDQQSYDISDYLTMKFFRDLEKIDSVKISEIDQLSRQYGENLYIAGSFGSRKIWFTNKQKRDECIYALQNSGRMPGNMMREGEFYHW
jgi:hypothetical protein